jgi:hypothetical protein
VWCRRENCKLAQIKFTKGIFGQISHPILNVANKVFMLFVVAPYFPFDFSFFIALKPEMTSSKIFSHASSSFRRGSKAHRRLRLGLQHPSILPGLDHFFFVTV